MKSHLNEQLAQVEKKRKAIAAELHTEQETLNKSHEARLNELFALHGERNRLELLQRTGLEVGAEIEADIEFLPGLHTKINGTVELRTRFSGVGGVKIGMLTYPFHGGPKTGYYITYKDLRRALCNTRFEDDRIIRFSVRPT
jgi:hypothetical protein